MTTNLNFSGISGVKTTKIKICEAESSGTNSDSSYRLCRYSIYKTNTPGVYERYKRGDADSDAISTILTKSQLIAEYDLFETNTRHRLDKDTLN